VVFLCCYSCVQTVQLCAIQPPRLSQARLSQVLLYWNLLYVGLCLLVDDGYKVRYWMWGSSHFLLCFPPFASLLFPSLLLSDHSLPYPQFPLLPGCSQGIWGSTKLPDCYVGRARPPNAFWCTLNLDDVS